MKYNLQIHIMPREEILDPQGKATQKGIHNLGYGTVTDVRVGKLIKLTIEADTEEIARQIAETSSKKLLANTTIEQYHIELIPA